MSDPDSGSRGGRARASAEGRRERIITRVRAIPEGFVRTYGDLDPAAPRLAGQVLSAYELDDLPWHRVVRSDGTVAKGEEQLELLRREGVPIRGERIDMRLARLPPELGLLPSEQNR